VGVLGLLVADDDELVREARGRECDTVIDISEIIHGEVKEDSSTSWEKILVVAESVTLLRAVLPCLSSMTSRSRRFDLVVGGQPRPAALRLPAGPVGLRSINSADRRAFKHPQPHVRLTVEFKGHLPIGDALAAFLSGGTSAFRRPAGGLRVGFAHSAAKAMPWACGDPAARQLLGERPALESGQPSPVDLVVAAEPAKRRTGSVPVLDVIGAHHRPSWTDLLYASGADIETFITRSRSDSLVPPVDTDVLNPVGFLNEPERGAAWLSPVERRTSRGLAFTDQSGRASPSFDDFAGLSERVVEYVRNYRVVHDDPRLHRGPVEHAAFLAQAACAALPVISQDLNPTVRRLLGPELATAFASTSEHDLADDLVREAYCMSIRRAAFARHGARQRWRAIADSLGLPGGPPPAPTVSVIMATRRPELLASIAEQIGGQDWPHVELVVGLHGVSAEHPKVQWMRETYAGPLVITEIPASRSFGETLNDLCGVASGQLLAKMDDDDWYSAHHITDLVHAAEFSRADLVGAGAEFMYFEALDLTVRRHRSSGNRYANRVPGASMLISAETLRAIGGWAPIPRGLDTALARAVTDSGGAIYRSHGLGIVVRRSAGGHTWDPGVEYFVRGDVQQWAGFAPAPGIIGVGPAQRSVPKSWFELQG